MIKTDKKKTTKKKASSKKANPGKDWIRHADLRPKGGSPDRSSSKDSDKIISNQEYYAKLHKLAEDIQWEKRNEYPIHGYPQWRALEDAAEILAKKKQNPSKKCRVIKVRRKISMGVGKRPRILQVRRKVCNPTEDFDLEDIREKLEYFWLNQSIVRIQTDGKRYFEGLIKPNSEYINWFKIYNYDNNTFSAIWIKLNNVLEINGNIVKVTDYKTSVYPPISDRR